MKKSVLLSAPLVVLAMCGITSPAYADSADAMCEVRKDGETKQGKSGPCTFSQRQGYIDLDLRNGDTYSLSPGNKPDHFKDQKGNKVVRTQAGGGTHVYKWDGGKKITVSFGASAADAGPTHSSASHDALVPGTDFHATTKIPCVAEPNKPMSQCDAGVKRTAGGGSVHVKTPDGGSRVITFSNGKVSGTDAKAPFKVERRDDWSIVRVGAVEVYEIPDALVFGG